MNTKIWLEKLSFGSNFGNLRAIGSNRVWCCFLAHSFKIKKLESISSNGSRDLAKPLKISFGSSFVSLRAFGSKFWQFRFSFDSVPYQYTPFKQKNRTRLSLPVLVLMYITFAHGRTDGRTDIFSKSFIFSS